MRIVSGIDKPYTNGEDLTITPFLFLVYVNNPIIKIYGIDFQWLNFAIYVGIGFGVPKGYPYFKNHNKQ